jgi:hypothetical protein
MSVKTYLINLFSFLYAAHCSANSSGHLCVFSARFLTIPFNACSPMLPENLFAEQYFSMFRGIFAKACIFGKFHPQPSSLGKQSFIILMRTPRTLEERCTCGRGCGSFTQRLNDKYSFRQLLNLFKEIFLSFISFHINFGLKCMCIIQSNTKQSPTLSEPHILIPSVIQLRMDMHGKSLSLCCSASFTKQRCKSLHDFLSFSLNLVPPIRLSRQPNMCFSKPVPVQLTCNILAGADPSNPYTSSPKGILSNVLEIYFCTNLLDHPQSKMLVSIPLM